MSETHFVFHGHFYQPPRENPWTGLVAREPGADPFHDWNARIDDECYRPNGFGRIVDDRQRVVDVVNNYAAMSFNVGPTLLAWLNEHDPVTLDRMIDADRVAASGGHGPAIAQAYNHVILPLADARDRATQIRWGLSVFRHHFGREAEALWLPETAANHAVLDDLIDHGMRFVILAPGQAGRTRPVGGGKWEPAGEARIDPSEPCLYRHRDGSGRSLVVFFYDGPLAHDISFGDALRSSDRFLQCVQRARKRARRGSLVHAAADGETAGHHNAWGDRVMAHALTRTLPGAGVSVTNYAALLDHLVPSREVELDPGPDGEGTAWSCSHGVGRWRRDCGCRIAPTPGWTQEWRAGLRDALDLLRDRARPWFEAEAGRLFFDPWAARDDYVQVLLEPGAAARERHLAEHLRPGLEAADAQRGLELLEMQHQLMLQYTSCGWFFDDIGGLESRQILRYAARALELWADLDGEPPVQEFLEILATARSNDPAAGDGARIFRTIQESDAVDPRRLAAVALLRGTESRERSGRFGRWSWEVPHPVRLESGPDPVLCGQVELTEDPIGKVHTFGVVLRRSGEFDVHVHFASPDRDFPALVGRLREALRGGAGKEQVEAACGPEAFDTTSLVNEGVRELLDPVFSGEFDRLREEVAGLVDRHGSLMHSGLGTEEADLLRAFARSAHRHVVLARLQARLAGKDEDFDLLGEMREAALAPERLRPPVERAVEAAIEAADPDAARRGLELARQLGVPLHLHRAQEAWLTAAGRFADRSEAASLGEALGLAPDLCEAVLTGSAPVQGGRR